MSFDLENEVEMELSLNWYFCFTSKDVRYFSSTCDWSKLRFDREVMIQPCLVFLYRCICRECAVENLAGGLEHRCCREIAQASQKLMFDGSIEIVSCITQHDDFSPMTNRSVLLHVGPLLRDKNGRGYRRRDGQTEGQ